MITGSKYQRCAEMIADTVEESFGITAPGGREKTIQSLIAVLAFYFPGESLAQGGRQDAAAGKN